MGRASASGKRYLAVGGQARVWRLELDPAGHVVDWRVRATSSALTGLASLGDLDGDGLGDVAITRGGERSITVEFSAADWSVASTHSFPGGAAPFTLAGLGDLTGDGIPDLAGATEIPDFSFSSFGTRVYLLQLGGIATAGFEHRDNADERQHENGRQIPRPHPGRTFVISSGGANLGATVFDSTPLGPNDPSQDRDLLVDSGMVLMLQNSQVPTQTVPGIFDDPNDDQDGGSLAFDFPRLVRPLSIEVCDIDPGANQAATVSLIDDQGKRRIYDVPPGFTEDRVANGGSGLRRLDLTTLAPQPGYVASATAAEQTGFAAARVVRIEVQLGSSGAVDDLVYDPYP